MLNMLRQFRIRSVHGPSRRNLYLETHGLDFVICRLTEHVYMGRGYYITAFTTKFKIRRGPFAVSPKVNGACSCSEGGVKL
jgi:hypothetical protein